VNFQVTVLRILPSYPDGFAVMEDIKRDMAILATSGRDWADRTKRLGARVPELDIFSQGVVDREGDGWKITVKGRAVLEAMEVRPAALEMAGPRLRVPFRPSEPLPPLRQPAHRAKRRRKRRERRGEACERARANAS
jgi:hypothetical protein